MADIRERMEQLELQIDETEDEHEKLELILKLGYYYSNAGSDQAAIYARQAHRLARSLDEKSMLARVHILQGAILINRSEFAKARRHLLRSWKLLKDLPEYFIEKIRVCRAMGVICVQHSQELGKALRWYRLGEHWACIAGNHPARAQLFYYMAVVFRDRGMLEREAELLGRALQILRKYPDDSLLARSVEGHSCSLLGTLHGEFEQWDTAFSYLRQSQKIFQDIEYLYGIASAHYDIGHVLYLKGQKEVDNNTLAEAMNEFRSALGLFESIDNAQMQSMVLVKMGTVCKVLGEPDNALQYFEDAQRHAGEKENEIVWASIQIEKAFVLIALEKWQDALAVLEPVIELGGESVSIALHDALAQAYEGAGNMERALFHYKLWVEKDCSVIRTAVERRLMNIEEAVREHDRKKMADEVNELELQQTREVSEQQKFTDELHKRTTVLEELRARLSLMKNTREVLPETVRNLLVEIDERSRKVATWEYFAQQIYAINHDVVPLLEQEYPSLTPTEIRVCLLLRINLSNKDIAELLNMAERTVDTHRSRVRRKMQLERREDLVSRLLALGTH